jgi:hypothetical protein
MSDWCTQPEWKEEADRSKKESGVFRDREDTRNSPPEPKKENHPYSNSDIANVGKFGVGKAPLVPSPEEAKWTWTITEATYQKIKEISPDNADQTLAQLGIIKAPGSQENMSVIDNRSDVQKCVEDFPLNRSIFTSLEQPLNTYDSEQDSIAEDELILEDEFDETERAEKEVLQAFDDSEDYSVATTHTLTLRLQKSDLLEHSQCRTCISKAIQTVTVVEEPGCTDGDRHEIAERMSKKVRFVSLTGRCVRIDVYDTDRSKITALPLHRECKLNRGREAIHEDFRTLLGTTHSLSDSWVEFKMGARIQTAIREAQAP